MWTIETAEPMRAGTLATLRNGQETITAHFAGMVERMNSRALRFASGDRNGQRFSELELPEAEFHPADVAIAAQCPHDPMPIIHNWHDEIVTPVSLTTGYMLHAIAGDDRSVTVELHNPRDESGGYVYLEAHEARDFARALLAMVGEA